MLEALFRHGADVRGHYGKVPSCDKVELPHSLQPGTPVGEGVECSGRYVRGYPRAGFLEDRTLFECRGVEGNLANVRALNSVGDHDRYRLKALSLKSSAFVPAPPANCRQTECRLAPLHWQIG